MVSRIVYNSSYIDGNGFAVTQYDNVLNAFFYDATKDPWHTPTLNSFTGFGRDGFKYTNGVQDAGPVSASWRTEASSATRGSGVGATFAKPDFPEHAVIVVSSSNATGQTVGGAFSPTTWDIIDADTNRHWMRFVLFSEAIASTTKMMAGGVGASHGAYGFTAFSSTNGRPSPVKMFNGSLFMGLGHGNGWGWVMCSFVKERAIYSQTALRYDWTGNIASRNGGGGWTLFDSVTRTAMGQVVDVDMQKLVGDGKEYLAMATYTTSWILRNTFECQWAAIEGFNRYYGTITQTDWFVQLTPSGKLYVWDASFVRVEVYYQVHEDANNSTNILFSAFYDNSNPAAAGRIAASTDQANAMFVTDQTSAIEPSSSTIFVAQGGHLITVISTYEIIGQENNAKVSLIGPNVIYPPVHYGDKDGGAGGHITFGRGSPTNVFPETTQFTWINHPMRNVGNTGASEFEFSQNVGAFPGMFWEIDSGASTTVPLSGLMVSRKIYNNASGNQTLHDAVGNTNEVNIDGINRNTNPVMFLRIARGTDGGERWFTIAFCAGCASGGVQNFFQGRFSGYMWVDGPGGGTTPSMSRLYRFDGGSSVDTATPVRIDAESSVATLPSSFSSPDFYQYYIALTPTTIKVYNVSGQPIGPGASNNFTNDLPFLTATDGTYNGGFISFGPSFNSNSSGTYYLVNELSVEPPQPAYSLRGGSYKVISISGDSFAGRDVGRLVVASTLESYNSPTIASEAHYQVVDMSVKYNNTGVDPVNGPQLFHVSSENNQVPDITSEWIYPGLPGPTG